MRVASVIILFIVAIMVGGYFVLESAKDSFADSKSVIRRSIVSHTENGTFNLDERFTELQ